MRNQKTLDVNDRRHAFQQHKRVTGPLRVLPDTLESPDPYTSESDKEVTETLSLGSLLSGEMTLAARTSTGDPAVLKVPHSLLAVLVTIALAMVGGGYWLVSTLARLEANTTTIMRQQERTFTHLETQKAYIDAETGQVKFMQGLLSRDQQKSLAEYQRANPMPATPNVETVRPEWMKEN